jgi:hypothetical protein
MNHASKSTSVPAFMFFADDGESSIKGRLREVGWNDADFPKRESKWNKLVLISRPLSERCGGISNIIVILESDFSSDSMVKSASQA